MAPGEARDFECPGSGIIDFPAVFREAERQGIRHFMIERDNVPDGLACMKSAGEYLRNLRY
jgi:sugar phosphate isomerase/epimerase